TGSTSCPVPAAGTAGGGGGTPTPSSTCPTNMATASLARTLNGGGDIADGSGKLKQHFSFHAAHKTEGNQNRTFGKLSYKNDDSLQFKSTQIQCVTFNDEGTDAKGHPKGSAEMRGVGRLKKNTDNSDSFACFRAFARDNGEPGGSKDGGSDQFSIDFVPVTYD